MEAIRDSSEQDDTFRAIADHVAWEEHPPEQKRPLSSRGTVTVSLATMGDATASIAGMPKDSMTVLATSEGHNKV